MKIFAFICFIFFFQSEPRPDTRTLELEGSKVITTYTADGKFYGKYQGSKNGYLILEKDGSGIYRYDYLGISPNCNKEIIEFEWGFVLDENGDVLKFERDYGYSYPVIYNCIGDNTFQGCTKTSMVDYILEYSDGTITVSSSDDWVKSDDQP